jgi:hypothetical protein
MEVGPRYRAGRARVEVSDQGLVIHRVGRTLTIDRNQIRDVQPVVAEDRLVALLWAPVIHRPDGDIELSSLIGYSRRGSGNRYVERQSAQIREVVQSRRCP